MTLSLDRNIALRDVQGGARQADPRATRRYGRNRYSLDRRPTHARLVQAGHAAISRERECERERRRAALERSHGQFRGVYGPGYLERLRGGWPA